jgi:hypothetical protein
MTLRGATHELEAVAKRDVATPAILICDVPKQLRFPLRVEEATASVRQKCSLSAFRNVWRRCVMPAQLNRT